MYKQLLFIAAAAFLVLGASQNANAQDLSQGAQLIADEASKDEDKLKEACKGGRDGIVQLVMQSVGSLMAAGQTQINASVDGPAAGGALSRKCRNLLR